MRYLLTDAEWRLIEPILPCKPRGVLCVDDRKVLNGIFWVLRSRAPWRDLPERYGPDTTCCNRFVRWFCAGVWDRVLAAISHRADADVQMIYSTIVRAHQHATCTKHGADEDLGRPRGGLKTKIHAVVDANGLPIRLALTPGHQHDSLCVAELLSDIPEGGMLLVDRACDSDAIRSLVAASGDWTNIPPRRNRHDPVCFSRFLYRDRNLVERFFDQIKHCRRIATRYEKRAANFPAFVKLAAILNVG